ncbi:hypothetical protein DSBG_2355 [Desulfosporosinus sp. BG]|nr:hypothetical protein DSBG_2355 [Desulfosporosinus sp. BG]
MLKVAVLLFTKEDYWAGADVAVKNGNCVYLLDHLMVQFLLSKNGS